MTLQTLLSLSILTAFCWFLYKRLLTYLQYFQQEEYDNRRFLQWLLKDKVFDRRVSLAILVMTALSIVISSAWWLIIVTLVFCCAAYFEINPQYIGKKKLILTQRARRILWLAYSMVVFFAAGVLVYVSIFAYSAMALAWIIIWLLPIHFIPFALVASNLLWQPYEISVQNKFWREAKDKMDALDPFVIGITGSFGKTSVKHILGHILQTSTDVLWTPGSVNTPMGNTRIIRERLTPEHQYFIVEMGAYGPGSIERLCKLTPPDMAVITAVGAAHYERFKSLETVAKAKFELAYAAMAKRDDAKVITHSKVTKFSAVEAFRAQHGDHLLLCGDDEGLALQIKSVQQTVDGLNVEVVYQGKPHILEAPLFGLHHGQNMAIAFLTACELGLQVEAIKTALKSVPQIEHRLNVQQQTNGSFIIDDAFNSNTDGFIAAMELLDLLAKYHGGRRILVTPGMVELGTKHSADHATVASSALKYTDIVLLICPDRIPSFRDTYLKSKSAHQQLIQLNFFAEAQNWMQQNLRAGDVILLENDLPDRYERKLVL